MTTAGCGGIDESGERLQGMANRKDESNELIPVSPFPPIHSADISSTGLPIGVRLVLCSLCSDVVKAQTFGCTPPMATTSCVKNYQAGKSSSEWDISGAGMRHDFKGCH